jgi:branched-chain amino acid transport system substrate-binding protein
MSCAEAPACSQSSAAFKAVLPKYDVQLAYTTSISYSAPSYAAQCLAAKDAGATGMVVGDASAIVEKVVSDCATQGFTPKEFTGDGTVATGWLKIPQFDGLGGVQEDLPWFVHNSATKPMYAALAKYAPQVLNNNPNFGEIVVETWADGELAQAAMNDAHLTSATPTAADMLTGLYALPKGTTLGGLTPPLHFKKGQPNPNRCWFTMSEKGGNFVLSNNGKLTCV